jgi:hypothetical protein
MERHFWRTMVADSCGTLNVFVNVAGIRSDVFWFSATVTPFHGDSTGSKSHRGAEIQCMFWCMFACDITAFYCDILQNCTDGQAFHSVNVMRIRALTCGLLQHSKIWTQNPLPEME